MGLAVRKKKGAHRTPADRCWTCLIVRIKRAPSCARRSITSMRKKQLRPLCIAFRPLSVFFAFEVDVRARLHLLIYQMRMCIKKSYRQHTQNTLLRSTAALRFADIISMPIFCSRKTNVYSHKLQNFASFFAV